MKMKPKKLLLISLECSSPLDWTCYGQRTACTPRLNQICCEAVVCYEHFAPTDEITTNWRRFWEVVTFPCLQWKFERSQGGKSATISDELASVQEFLRSPDAVSVGWIQLQQVAPMTDAADERNLPGLSQTEPLQQLETLIKMLWPDGLITPDNGVNLTLILTAGCGDRRGITEQATPLTRIAAQSLSMKLWIPLVIWNSAQTNKELCPVLSLTSMDGLATAVNQWLRSETSELIDICAKSAASAGDRELLLQTSEQIGYRTEKDLLVVNREQLSGFNLSELPGDAGLFYKPEDRFDVNNMGAADPGRGSLLWQQMLAGMKTEK